MEQNFKKGLPPVIDKSANILILGTLPSYSSIEKGEYYSGKNNGFWQVMSKITNEDLSIMRYEDKINALKKHNIAIWDILESCYTVGTSNADHKILPPIKENNLNELLINYQNIQYIFLNGKTLQSKKHKTLGTYGYYKKYFNNIKIPIKPLHSTSWKWYKGHSREVQEEWLNAYNSIR